MVIAQYWQIFEVLDMKAVGHNWFKFFIRLINIIIHKWQNIISVFNNSFCSRKEIVEAICSIWGNFLGFVRQFHIGPPVFSASISLISSRSKQFANSSYGLYGFRFTAKQAEQYRKCSSGTSTSGKFSFNSFFCLSDKMTFDFFMTHDRSDMRLAKEFLTMFRQFWQCWGRNLGRFIYQTC